MLQQNLSLNAFSFLLIVAEVLSSACEPMVPFSTESCLYKPAAVVAVGAIVDKKADNGYLWPWLEPISVCIAFSLFLVIFFTS